MQKVLLVSQITNIMTNENEYEKRSLIFSWHFTEWLTQKYNMTFDEKVDRSLLAFLVTEFGKHIVSLVKNNSKESIHYINTYNSSIECADEGFIGELRFDCLKKVFDKNSTISVFTEKEYENIGCYFAADCSGNFRIVEINTNDYMIVCKNNETTEAIYVLFE